VITNLKHKVNNLRWKEQQINDVINILKVQSDTKVLHLYKFLKEEEEQDATANDVADQDEVVVLLGFVVVFEQLKHVWDEVE
jgi:hypothetical protein